MTTKSMRYAARAVAGVAAAVVAVGFAVPAASSGAAGSPPTPDPQWGANQARPVGPPGQDPSSNTGSTTGTGQLSSSSPRMAAPLATTAAAATPGWVLHGAGWGHGIGMSQYGAMEMARDGYKAPQILAHYYTGTTYNAVPDNMWVNVNIVYGASSFTTTSSVLSGGNGAFTLSLGGTIMKGVAGNVVAYSVSAGKVKATCYACSPSTAAGATAVLSWDDRSDLGASTTKGPTLMKIAGTQYRDGAAVVTVKPGTSTLNAVMQVRIHDEYLDYIAESPWSWPGEALRAQAAAARGYVIAKYQALGTKVQEKCNCHVFDTTSDQVYGGYTTVLSNGNQPYWPSWKSAVRATGTSGTGYVARYGGNIIQAFFSSSSGGRTENNEDVWGGTPLPYLRGVADPWSLRASNPNRAWRQTTSGASMSGVFGLSDVVRLDLRDRTVNGGVKYATATSSSGARSTVRGDSLRAITASPGGAVKSTMIRHLTSRLSGADRYASAAAVARRFPTTANAVVLAGGDTTLSDASVAGPLATTVGGPLLLTQESKLPSATVAELNRRGSAVKTAYIVGGTGVVSSAVESQLRSRGLAIVRLGGRDRYQTSALVAQTIKSKRGTVGAVVVAGGFGLPDALGASGPAAALKEPILLTPASAMSAYTRQGLAATGAKTARVVGGTAVVGDRVIADLKAAGVTTVNRLAGADRYATSGAVAAFYRSKVPNTSEVVLTSGADTALVDSLVAGTTQRLIALTKKSSLVEPAAQTLQMTPLLETVTAVGGAGALANSALAAAANS
jgi:stage II sporulation protein D